MAVEEKNLRELLTSEAVRERQAWKRSSLLVGMIALGGLLWLSFSAYKVIRMERESARLSANIRQQTIQLNELQTNVNSAKADLEETNRQLKIAAAALTTAKAQLEAIVKTSQEATTKAQAQKALRVVNNASKDIRSTSISLRATLADLFMKLQSNDQEKRDEARKKLKAGLKAVPELLDGLPPEAVEHLSDRDLEEVYRQMLERLVTERDKIPVLTDALKEGS